MQTKIRLITAFAPQHYRLLLLADPLLRSITSYLANSSAFELIYNRHCIGIIVVQALSPSTIEIMNLAIQPKYQGQHLASHLLQFVIDRYSSNTSYERLEIKTGTTSFEQLYLYQKFGFRCVRILPNYFVNHDLYPEPIYENHLKLQDAIVLERSL